MEAYSVDLRARIVAAVKDEGLSKSETARRYKVSRASVYRYLDLDKQGSLAAKPRPGCPRRLDAALCEKLLAQLEENRDASLEEHAELFAEAQGVALKKSSMGTYFARLGVRRKKDAARPRA